MRLNEPDTVLLDRAATLLAGVGFSDTAQAPDPAVAIYALTATEHLHRAGATPGRITMTDPREAIAEALRALAGLSDRIFSLDAVADAVDAAQDAYAATAG